MRRRWTADEDTRETEMEPIFPWGGLRCAERERDRERERHKERNKERTKEGNKEIEKDIKRSRNKSKVMEGGSRL